MAALEFNNALAQFGLAAPETLTLSLLERCNLRCSHCWHESSPSVKNPVVIRESARQVTEDFAALGGRAIRFTGGEPLLHPDWLDLLSCAGAAGLKVILQTNGMLFADADIANLQALNVSDLQLEISLDGATAEIHDRVRGQGAFKATLEGLDRLAAGGFSRHVSLSFTEMSHNLHELPDLFDLADRLDVDSVTSGCLVVCGRSGKEDAVFPPTVEQYELLLDRYARDPLFRDRYDRLGRVAALEWSDESVSQPGCHLILNPFISSSGSLYPCLLCQADPYSVSGTFEKGLKAALLEGLPMWSRLQEISRERPRKLEECRSCFLHSSCAGGCMGRAWESYGDFFTPDDRCQQRQTVMSWKREHDSPCGKLCSSHFSTVD